MVDGRTVSFFLSSLLASCASHVCLCPPPPSASLEERQQAYERLKPVFYTETAASVFTSGDQRSIHLYIPTIWLGDGTVVRYPEDLLPVVRPDSATANAALKNRFLRRTTIAAEAVALTAMVVGWGLAYRHSGFLALDQMDTSTTAGKAGLGLFLGGIVWGLVSGIVLSSPSSDSQTEAFRTYGKDLKDGLGLSFESGQAAQ